MKAVLQRVSSASIKIKGELYSQIDRGIVILLGIEKSDSEKALEEMVKKVAGIRIFDDVNGKMNLSNETIKGEYLVVPQFTLCSDLSKGKRPGFKNAMPPPDAELLYKKFCGRLSETTGLPVKTGVFGSTMLVEINNFGPATFILSIS